MDNIKPCMGDWLSLTCHVLFEQENSKNGWKTCQKWVKNTQDNSVKCVLNMNFESDICNHKLQVFQYI